MSSGEIGESPDSGIALYRGNQYQIFKNSERGILPAGPSRQAASIFAPLVTSSDQEHFIEVFTHVQKR
ncbi:MAG: hypothetical protein ABS69_01975 [Nitrosomonadales bacterium SCN 54-20]|nr:MAG: hypothetical protein ABS69_01975 [Nitrosomonadales bacterium SCN 54-20]